MIRKFLRIFTMVCFLGAAVVGCEIDEEEAEEGSKDAPVVLTVDTWTNGEIANAGDEQWFSFVATASTQRVYVKFSTLTGMRVYLYDDGYNQMGDSLNTRGSASYVNYFEKSVTKGKTYHVKVAGYYSDYSGTYWIGFTESPMQPETVITPLTKNTWLKGDIVQPSSGGTGEQWFSFVATASTQNIYVKFGTLTDLYVCVYDNKYNQIGDGVRLRDNTGRVKSLSKSVTAELTYYIKIMGYDGKAGTYWIGFTDSLMQPETVITALTKNTWRSGDIIQPSNGGTGEQWFKFVPNAPTQYIYVKFGALTDLYVSVYDSNYNQIGDGVRLRDDTGRVKSLSKSLITELTYYIKIAGYDGKAGTYWLTFNSTGEAPQ